GLRWTALATLAPAAGAAALVIAHATGRGSIAIALNRSTYARSKGTGELVSRGVPDAELWRTLAIAAALALLFGWAAGLVAAIIGGSAALLLHMRVERRIGGYTGDTLGAMEQVCEIAVLLALSAMWSVS
ncbi:MAG TPA: adenosylcobinamide-GDP ribazoletransferase, partial [Rhizobiaceae bacterium]|nr:adenosylcobinamide-GDP ribazoletransferase [Rhizobiaceae bacterium]